MTLLVIILNGVFFLAMGIFALARPAEGVLSELVLPHRGGGGGGRVALGCAGLTGLHRIRAAKPPASRAG